MSYSITLVPPIFYLIVCFTMKPNTQIVIGAILSAGYSIMMGAVTVGSVIAVAETGLFSPNASFLACKYSYS